MRLTEKDLEFMREALAEAKLALARGEVPVGAVVVVEDKIVGRGHNQPISLRDPTAHAEIIAIRQAAATLGTYRLEHAILYSTLEPCVMCVGAIINARIPILKFGAWDEKAGAVGSVYDLGRDGRLNHRIEVYPAIMAEDCALILRDFFRARRSTKAVSYSGMRPKSPH